MLSRPRRDRLEEPQSQTSPAGAGRRGRNSLRRARRAADRRAAEAEAARLAAEALREETAVRLAAEALREETAVRRDVIEALHRRVEELERELAMRAVQGV